jgi:hypothetical protein
MGWAVIHDEYLLPEIPSCDLLVNQRKVAGALVTARAAPRKDWDHVFSVWPIFYSADR